MSAFRSYGLRTALPAAYCCLAAASASPMVSEPLRLPAKAAMSLAEYAIVSVSA